VKNILYSLSGFLALSLLIGGIYYFTYESSKTALLDQAKFNLAELNLLMQLKINGDELEQLIENGKDGDELYQKVIAQVVIAHEKIKNQIKYVYTVHQKNNKFIFGIDTAKRADLDGDGKIDHAFLGDVYVDAPEAVKLSFLERKLILSDEPYTDSWGTFVSSFNPIYNSKNKIIGALGMDIDLSRFLKDSRDFGMKLLMSLIIIEIIIGLLSIFGFLYLKNRDKELLLNEKNRQQEISLIQLSKLAEIGMLTASISHEINTPLSVIRLQSSRLKNSKTIDKIQEIGDKIEKAVQRVLNTVQTMENFIRKSDGKKELKTVQTIISELIPLISGSTQDIKFTIENNSKAEFECWPNQITQVLINLIQNSCQVLKDQPDAWIVLKSFDEKDEIRIELSDSGTGISENLLKQIELGFFSTKEKSIGSGMGLMISRKIIENHLGTLQYLKNRVNTTFLIILPIKQSDV
jgi:signal transduction histidine kinase